jgi:hypothetical protein
LPEFWDHSAPTSFAQDANFFERNEIGKVVTNLLGDSGRTLIWAGGHSGVEKLRKRLR